MGTDGRDTAAARTLGIREMPLRARIVVILLIVYGLFIFLYAAISLVKTYTGGSSLPVSVLFYSLPVYLVLLIVYLVFVRRLVTR